MMDYSTSTGRGSYSVDMVSDYWNGKLDIFSSKPTSTSLAMILTTDGFSTQLQHLTSL